jgi:hypothetical protein
MRRNAASALALAIILALVGISWAQADGPITGVRVVPIKQFNELEARVTVAEGRLDALEATEPTPTPTEEPTPTDPPDPEPTEEPTPEPEPEPAGFPTRDSVGPDVDPTTAYAGDCYFSAAESGTVVDGKVLDCDSAGGVRFAVDARNIVFRNSIIRGQMFTIGATPGDAGADTFPREPVFTVEDSKVIQSTTVDWQDRAACCGHYVIKRSLIQGTHSGIGAHNNVTLIGNYITTDGTDSHSSGVRVLKNTVVRGNTIQCKPVTPGSDGGCSAAAVFYSEDLGGNSAAAFNLTIEGNYFKRGVTPYGEFDDNGDGKVDRIIEAGQPGGPWNATRFINCENRTDCTGITFTDNQFDLGWGTDGGEFPSAYGGNTWADNVWADGQTATSGQSR